MIYTKEYNNGWGWQKRIAGVIVQEGYCFDTQADALDDAQRHPLPELNYGLAMRLGKWTYTIYCGDLYVYRSTSFNTCQEAEAAAQEHLEDLRP